jgi:hypothetical protein
MVSFAQKSAPKTNSLRVPFTAEKAFETQFPFHSFREIVETLRKKSMPTKKEFETTDEYNARYLSWENGNFFGEISPNSALALMFSPSTMGVFPTLTYDTDNGLMALKGLPRLCTVPLTKTGTPFVGSNAFGVRTIVSVMYATQTCVDLDARSLDEFDVTFPVEKQNAQSLKNNWALVAIGKLKVPYYNESHSMHEPTIDNPVKLHLQTMNAYFDPTEFVIVNAQSKEVVARIPSEKAIVLKEAFRR